MLFSIIVPVYKVEKYLSQCIESVLCQKCNDFELILINDGSPDNSGIICDKYAKKDNRIRVIHKENGGVSDARNSGLSIAMGEFVLCLDSDDYLADSALNDVKKFIMQNNDIDMITCAHINDYGKGCKELVLLPYTSLSTLTREDFLWKLYKSKGDYWAPWKNIYRNSIIKENNLRFNKDFICAEDCDFFMRFIQYSEKFSFFNTPVVYYRINREDSITNSMSKAAIMSELAVFKGYYNHFKKNNHSRKQYMTSFFANKFAHGIYHLYHLTNNEDINELILFIEKNKKILKDTEGFKYNLVKLIWLLFGYYNGSIILNKIKRILNNFVL